MELIHPHGTVDAAGTVNHYVQSIRDLTRTLAARGFTGAAAELRRAQLAEYWMAASGPREACTRRMLQAFAYEPAGASTLRWPSSRPAAPTTRSATIARCRPIRKPSGTS